MSKKFIVALLILTVCSYKKIQAQPGGPGGGGDPDVPITGIEYLIGLGGFLGVKKLVQSRNKRSKN